ncbi:hypothetical protein BX600DRAFT_468265 [Xylariales sp. PMI_506]|nr:hypothetical protein BX600DRAFT_468265 [Xylariales sp. PMI_506]
MDEQRSPTPGSSRGGKACVNCVRIKCKCVPRALGSSCERCHRLQKECVPSAAPRRRGPKPHVAQRSARLEEKLDDLVSLLRAQQLPSRLDAGDRSGNDSEYRDTESGKGTSSSLALTPAADEEFDNLLPPAEAEISLERFRKDMTPSSPYIYIPSDLTSNQLRGMYPFLWVNIMRVASNTLKLRNSLNAQIRRTIVQRIVSNSERSLDLLFGMIIFVNWAHLFPMDKHFLCLASQLLVSLVWDLELQMPPSDHPSKCFRAPQPPPTSPRHRTIEERRVVLGVFVVTSVVSQSFKAADGLRWSPHLDDYLSYLSRHSDVEQDLLLIAQVKIQLIVNQVHYSSWRHGNVEIPAPYLDALKSQLDDISGISGNEMALKDSPMVHNLYRFATLIIHESTMFKTPNASNIPDLRRYEIYQRCLVAIKAWFDTFFSNPLEMYGRLPFGNYVQLYYTIGYLHRITIIKDPDWAPAAAREVIELLPTIDRILVIFEQSRAVAAIRNSETEEDEAISFGLTKLRRLKLAWQHEIESQGREDGVIDESGVIEDSQELFPGLSLSLLDYQIVPDMLDFSW